MRKLGVTWGSWRLYTRNLEVVWLRFNLQLTCVRKLDDIWPNGPNQTVNHSLTHSLAHPVRPIHVGIELFWQLKVVKQHQNPFFVRNGPKPYQVVTVSPVWDTVKFAKTGSDQVSKSSFSDGPSFMIIGVEAVARAVLRCPWQLGYIKKMHPRLMEVLSKVFIQGSHQLKRGRNAKKVFVNVASFWNHLHPFAPVS